MSAVEIAEQRATTPGTESPGDAPGSPAPRHRVIALVSEESPDGGGQAAPTESVSVVIPVYNEEGNLVELHSRLSTALTGLTLPYEILFVDDGSTDGTWAVIRSLASDDPHVVGFRHRRNFGKARALALGFDEARGSIVVTMDGDLQDDPDELPHFLKMLDDGYDLVSGWKQQRQDPLGKTVPSRFFNFVVSRVSGLPLHDFNCGYKAYRIEAARSLRLYGELHRFTPVLAHAEGFRIGELPVQHHARRWGRSKYGWSRLIKGFLDLVTVKFLTEYRQRPMHILGLPGLLAMGLGVLAGLYLIIDRFLTGAPIGTRPMLSLAVLLVVIGGQFFGLGLVGELLTHSAFPGKRSLSDGADSSDYSVREMLKPSNRTLRGS